MRIFRLPRSIKRKIKEDDGYIDKNTYNSRVTAREKKPDAKTLLGEMFRLNLEVIDQDGYELKDYELYLESPLNGRNTLQVNNYYYNVTANRDEIYMKISKYGYNDTTYTFSLNNDINIKIMLYERNLNTRIA